MQTLQHKAIFAKKVSITVILIFENKTTQIECLTVNAKTAQMKKEKVMGQSWASRDGEINCSHTGITC